MLGVGLDLGRQGRLGIGMLVLDGSGNIGPQATFSRATTGTDLLGPAFDTYAIDAPRAGNRRGATNMVRNPRGEGASAQTNVSGATGQPTNWTLINHLSGLSIDLTPVSAEGMNGIRLRFYGTTGGSPGAETVEWDTRSAVTYPALGGQPYTGSFWIRLVSGTLPRIGHRFITRSAVPAVLDNSLTQIFGLDTTLRRISGTITTNPAAADIMGGLNLDVFTASTAYDFTIELFWPQLELGAPVSPILLPPVGVPGATTAMVPVVPPRGLLIEAPITNTVASSIAMTNFSAGAPGNTAALTTEIAPPWPGAGVLKLTRGDPVTFTDNNCSNVSIGTPGASTAIVVSCYMYVTSAYAGTAAGLNPTFDAASSNFATLPYDLTRRNTWQRVYRAVTTNAGVTGVAASQLRLSGAANGDFVYVALFQSESGTVPTSYVPTLGSSVSRNLDFFTISGAALLELLEGNSLSGCVVAEVQFEQAVASGVFRSVIQIDEGAGVVSRLEARPGTGQTTIILVPMTGGVQGAASGTAGAPIYGTPMRIGLRWGGGAAGISMNGGAIQTLAFTTPGFATLRIGTTAAGAGGMNGRVRSLRVVGTPPDDATFRAMTTLGS